MPYQKIDPNSAIKLYDGKVELDFDSEVHAYTVNDTENKIYNEVVTGVTSATKMVDKSFALMNWAVKEAIEHIKNNVKIDVDGVHIMLEGQQTLTDELNFKQLLDEAKAMHRVKKETAGDIGTLVHQWIERYIKATIGGHDMPNMPAHEMVRNGVDAFLEWEKEHTIKYVSSEKFVYSRQYKYAGTADVEAEIDGKYAMIDLKTSSIIADEHRYQVAAYAHARQEETGKAFDERWILRLGKKLKKGKVDFEVKKLEDQDADFDCFLGCLKLVRRYRQIHPARNWKKKSD